jgi:transposase
LKPKGEGTKLHLLIMRLLWVDSRGNDRFDIYPAEPFSSYTLLEVRSWQAKTADGYDQPHFTIDWENLQATCPQGKTSAPGIPRQTQKGTPTYHFYFSAQDCLACPARPHCTHSKTAGRQITVLPETQLQALQAARQRQKTEAFKQLYQARAGIEGTISQATNALQVRRARYRGLARLHLQHLATATAINFCRAADWLFGLRPETTRTDPFVALARST